MPHHVCVTKIATSFCLIQTVNLIPNLMFSFHFAVYYHMLLANDTASAL